MFKATRKICNDSFNLLLELSKKAVRKKNRILIGIVALMGISLIGMCAIQVFWIRQAYEVQNEHFKSQVNEALMSVANRLQMIETTSIIIEASAKAEAIEKGETVPYYPSERDDQTEEIEPQNEADELPVHPAISYNSSEQDSNGVFKTVASTKQQNTHDRHPICSNKFFVTTTRESRTCSIMVKGGNAQPYRKTSVDRCKKRAHELHYVFSQLLDVNSTPPATTVSKGFMTDDHSSRIAHRTSYEPPYAMSVSYPTDHFHTRYPAGFVSLPFRRFDTPSDTVLTDENQITGEKFRQKADLLEDIIKELTVVNRPIEQRVNLCTLDSLIHVELKNFGINRDFVYGIMGRDSMIASAQLSRDAAMLSPFKVPLFPYDLNNATYQLVLNFTDAQPSFWHYNSGMLGLAGLFLSLIIVCFGYTVVTIHNQKKLSQMKQDFISNMTHEFKTPITTISLISETLAGVTENTKPEKIKKFANIIAQENKRLEDQVVRVLQMAEIERKEINLNLEEVDVNGTIAEALNNACIQVESRGGVIHIELCEENPIITADALHFTNIVTNLLDNANKYSPKTPEIAVKTTCNKKGVTISVTDKGLGMTQDQIRHIFDKFYRVHTGDRHDIKGFGLGLSYVKSMVEAHGGSIKVDSKPNVGSRFDVFFPYQPQNVA